MSYRAGCDARMAAAMGIQPGGPRILCDGPGCDAVRHIPEWPPQWFIAGKSPPLWHKASRQPRRDLCPKCKPAKKR